MREKRTVSWQGLRRAYRHALRACVFFIPSLGLVLLGAVAARADGVPRPWQMGFQDAASPNMAMVENLHNFVLWIITGIVVFVVVLMAFILWRFHESRNPRPTSRNTHNTVLEVLWTVVPVFILMVMAVPSLRLLYAVERIPPDPDLTIRATGYQWYWSYAYPDHGIAFDSLMLEEDELAPGQPRLLATDNNIVVPAGKTVRVQVAGDPDGVIHSWAVPALGVKVDAVPGRLNETWFSVDKQGIYYGQCSELCGLRHAFMPIAVQVVSDDAFAAWLKSAAEEHGDEDDENARDAGGADASKANAAPDAPPRLRLAAGEGTRRLR